MRTFSRFVASASLALLLAVPVLAQQAGGLRIVVPATDDICKDETASADTSRKIVLRQEDLARELLTLLKRTAEIQKKLSAGAEKDVRAELARMIERTGNMIRELEGMTGGAKAP